MKIIVSYRGVPQARGWEAGACLARAFRELGCEVAEFGTCFGFPDRRLSEGPPPSGADLWIYVECGDAEPPYGEVLASDARVKVYWEFDTTIHRGFSLEFIERVGFDHVFLGNWREAPLIRTVAPAVHFLPYAVAADRLSPLPEVEKVADAGMVGQLTRGRVRLLESLRGAGLSAVILQGKFGVELARAINSFRIGLNYEVTGGGGLLNGRVWEVLGCGVFLLNERGNGIEELFEDGRHLALFSTPAECVEKARYYLAHPAEAAAIAAEGRRHALACHTYRQRAEALLACLKAPAPAAEPVSAAIRCRARVIRLAYRASRPAAALRRAIRGRAP